MSGCQVSGVGCQGTGAPSPDTRVPAAAGHLAPGAGHPLPAGLLERARHALAARPSALMSDFDGTLSPIAPTPEQAQLAEGARDALAALAHRVDLVAIVTGRAVADVRAKVGLPGLVYVGNHGVESMTSGRVETLPEAERYRPLLERAADFVQRGVAFDGLYVEWKGLGVSLHYRLSADWVAARAAILALLDRAPEGRALRITEGRAVVELRPPIQANKGTAVERLVRRHGLRGVIILGDDLTDLDALRALRGLSDVEHLGIAVGAEAGMPVCDEADYCLESVRDAIALLSILANLEEF